MVDKNSATLQAKTAAELAREAINLLHPDYERIEEGRLRLQAVWRWQDAEKLPILVTGPHHRPATKNSYPYRKFDHVQQIHDRDAMLVEQVWKLPEGQGDSRGDSQPTVMADFGTVTVATTFGVKAQLLPHTPPWIGEHLSRKEIAKVIRELDPDTAPQRGLTSMAMERSDYFRELLGDKARVISFNHQSPLDIAYQVRGADFLYDLYDDPAFVHEFLDFCTDVYVAVARAFNELINEPADRSWSDGVAVADDVSVLLGPEHFFEFSLPSMRRALKTLGGGLVHFCGDAHHILDGYLSAPEVKAINLGQPELYDPAIVMPRLLAAKTIYSGGWPVHPDESLDDYIRRILELFPDRLEGLILGINRWKFDLPPEDIANRWYALQEAT